jgi:hypothetical protein
MVIPLLYLLAVCATNHGAYWRKPPWGVLG